MKGFRNHMRRRVLAEPGRGDVNTTGWLTTFNDLVTLLMVFFVLLFSMSTIDTKRLKNFQSALQAGLGVLEAGKKTTVAIVDANRPASAAKDQEAVDVQSPTVQQDQIASIVESTIKTMQVDEPIQATYTDEGVIITLTDNIVFASGSDRIQRTSHQILGRIAGIIHQVQNPVRIDGHSDNVPIHTSKHPSNWELSTSRAVNVVKFLIEKQGIAPPAAIRCRLWGFQTDISE